MSSHHPDPHPQPFAPSHDDIPPAESLSDPSALASLLSRSAPLQDRLEAQRASPNPAIREAEEVTTDWGRGRVSEDGWVVDGEEGRVEMAASPTNPSATSPAHFPIPSSAHPPLEPAQHRPVIEDFNPGEEGSYGGLGERAGESEVKGVGSERGL
ncbi:hypothetical protein JCM8097_003470 [Rhodosporidiobolus ruineniae]